MYKVTPEIYPGYAALSQNFCRNHNPMQRRLCTCVLTLADRQLLPIVQVVIDILRLVH